jgi:DNA-binding response OmpR family regulator
LRILVVEDEGKIAADIIGTLEASGYQTDRAADGEEAWFKGGTENYAAVILDLGLPKMDGVTILKRWRSEGIMTPVLVLTARGSWSERVEGIDAGADDYLPKPFRMEELLARLRAILRRTAGSATAVITVGEVTVDTRSASVMVRGAPVALTPLEFRLLNYLFHHRGRVISQAELCDGLYDVNNERDANAVEALVARLRRKLKADIIETKRGFGYRVAEAAA